VSGAGPFNLHFPPFLPVRSVCSKVAIMKRLTRAIVLCATLAGAAAALSPLQVFAAEPYPSRPITIVVPLAAGGPLDTMARIISEPMRASLGQAIIVENVTGASGTIGAGRVAHSAPDGLTLGLGFLGTHVLNGAIYQLNYDVVKDFEPIALLSSNPHVIVTNPAVPATDLKGLVSWLRAHQDMATVGTAGVGSTTHMGAVLFANLIGVHMAFVPYRGAAPALQDVIAGQTNLMVDVLSNSLPYVQSGKVRSFGVTAAKRVASAPDIPTVDEAGLPGLYISTWYALFGPKGLPHEIVAKLDTAVRAALADPAVRRRCAEVGLAIPPPEEQTPQALAALQRAEIERWWPIVKTANIKPE
jgi:tripartite-type tricarboxylate transporter receptor subunit TctC